MSNLDGTSQAFELLKDAFRDSYVDPKGERWAVCDAITGERLAWNFYSADDAKWAQDEFKQETHLERYWVKP